MGWVTAEFQGPPRNDQSRLIRVAANPGLTCERWTVAHSDYTSEQVPTRMLGRLRSGIVQARVQ